ncbi:hypothetical protein ACHQM5_030210 [Ranunculus cassubicifolius]
MVDGTSSPPVETITVMGKPVPNPSFLEWKKMDQILLSWLHRTLTTSVFSQVTAYKTSRSLWEALHRSYTSQTNARYFQIKSELATIRKGSSSISEYIDRIRQLTDELSLIQEPMTDRDVIGTVLQGLDLDYDVVVNQVQTMTTVPSIEELYSMLLNREKRLEVYHTSAHTSATAMLASNNRGFHYNRVTMVVDQDVVLQMHPFLIKDLNLQWSVKYATNRIILLLLVINFTRKILLNQMIYQQLSLQ